MLINRQDGDLVRDVPASRRIMPFIMPTRTESAVGFEQAVDAGPGLAFIARWNARNAQKITFFHLVVAALVQTLHERPRLNRFVMGSRLWQRRGIWVSYSAKKALNDDAPIVVVKQRFEPGAGFAALVDQLHAAVREGRSDAKRHVDRELGLFLALPAPVLRLGVRLLRWLDAWNLLPHSFIAPDPMYASVFVANLGSVKLDAAFHHLYEYGNIPIFVAIGRLHRAPNVTADGSVGVREELTLRWTFDERIEDGLYCARALELLRERLEHPDCLASELTAGEVRAS
jgi:hypothetical protein